MAPTALKKCNKLAGSLRANAFYGSECLLCSSTQSLNALEVCEECHLTGWAQSGKVVEHGFADSAPAQLSVVRMSKTVGFIAQTLEELESWVVQGQCQGSARVAEYD